MATLTIPAAVIDHWRDRLDEIKRLGVTQPTDATYAKVLAARDARTAPVRIQADAADMAELQAECAAWLDDETDIAIGRDADDRRIRAGYQRLRASLNKPRQR